MLSYIYNMSYYGRKRYNRNRRYRPYRPRPDYKAVRRVVKREINKDNAQDHPLMWYDFNSSFDGDYVKTSPTVISFGKLIRDFLTANSGVTDSWRFRNDPTGVGKYREAKIKITGLQYQLRYQQNAEATAPTTDTVRHLFYSFADTWDENDIGILDGGDIDQAPNTTKVLSMHWDKLATLRGQTTEISTDDTQFVPGQRIFKGFKRLGKQFDFVYNVTGNSFSWKQEDLRFEHQSDDNSLIGNVQVYGFFRIYFRIM